MDKEVVIKTTEGKRKSLLAFLDRVNLKGVREANALISIVNDINKATSDFKEIEDTSKGEEGG